MKKETFTLPRDVEANVYSYNEEGCDWIAVAEGMPIKVMHEQKEFSCTDNCFDEVLLKSMLKIFENDFDEFSSLYLDLSTKIKSVYFNQAVVILKNKLEEVREQERKLNRLLHCCYCL